MTATLDLILIREAAAGEIVGEPDGFPWAGRLVDGETSARLRGLLDAGFLQVPFPGVERASVKVSDAGWGLFR